MRGASATASVALHAVLAALVVTAPLTGQFRPWHRTPPIEIEVARVPPAEPETGEPSAEPEDRPRAASAVTRARAPRAEPRAREPRAAPRVATVEPELREPRPEPRVPATERLEPTPPLPSLAPIAPFGAIPFADVAALAAAIEPFAPRGTAGTTIRGDAGGGDGDGRSDEGAVDAVRDLTQELRERAHAGRPEAPGVATYFQESRKRFGAAWAPRTVHLPSRTKAMIQSMQAVNRAALDMMEGRSDRAQAAQLDGRVTPNEWRDAMRDAAQQARAVNSAIVAVVYDEAGRMVDVQITRSSGHADLDRSVLAAAREGVGQEPAPSMPADPTASRPAGRVARYRFDVMMTAIPPVPPIVGVTFDESTGMFRVFYPGQINWKLRVVFLGARHGMDVRPQSRERD